MHCRADVIIQLRGSYIRLQGHPCLPILRYSDVQRDSNAAVGSGEGAGSTKKEYARHFVGAVL